MGAFPVRARMGAAPILLLVGLAYLVGCAGGDSSPGAHIDFEADPQHEDFGSIMVVGLPVETLTILGERDLRRDHWLELFVAYTGATDSRAADQPAILGDYTIEGDILRFTPRFPFDAGSTYHASFHGDRLASLFENSGFDENLELEFVMPVRGDSAPPRVTAVHPSQDELPENLLRIYVHFSEPMMIKQTEEHVRLFDGDGNEVELPFVEVEHGLWDITQKRLTLFLHPGRIKRNVGPNSTLGPPLREGETYRLVIDGEFRDETGRQLGTPYEWEFRVTAADRVSPDPAKWTVAAPANGDEPLVLTFPEPLDHGLLQRFILVENGAGLRIYGEITITEGETRWSFRPDEPWTSGDYTIKVHPKFEDLAGNLLDRLFEEAGGDTPAPALSTPVEIPFRVP